MTANDQAAGNWSNGKIENDASRIDKDTEFNSEAIATGRVFCMCRMRGPQIENIY
ncbi:hypothetical protein GWO53_09445 [Corynebacterium macginleyi]|nr:hypothetical protein [Corynebacterium macginleyi]MBK4141257.1 hypothetical protein [Corynebacterium macginleyi]MBK4149643.1 hypothetical protein [Corynebacterium macginleyi]MBK4152425.1 hypothetical protein [Corynebacterium macginleyi]MBK4162710.1 hypothetical protein [Corynebacterium macginleyi]